MGKSSSSNLEKQQQFGCPELVWDAEECLKFAQSASLFNWCFVYGLLLDTSDKLLEDAANVWMYVGQYESFGNNGEYSDFRDTIEYVSLDFCIKHDVKLGSLVDTLCGLTSCTTAMIVRKESISREPGYIRCKEFETKDEEPIYYFYELSLTYKKDILVPNRQPLHWTNKKLQTSNFEEDEFIDHKKGLYNRYSHEDEEDYEELDYASG